MIPSVSAVVRVGSERRRRPLAWRRHLFGIVGLMIVGSVLVGAATPALVSPHAPEAQDIANRLAPPIWSAQGASVHVLGTDQLGRDLLARIAHGGRVSLLVGAVAVGIAGPVGLALGVLSGFYGGSTETLTMGLVDVLLATPFVLLAIVIAALVGPGLRNVLIVLTVTGWVVFCRVIHSRTLSVKASEFIEAARALGADDLRILWRHVLPHVMGPFIVIATLQVGRMMLAEAALSFLGLGVEANRPTWGTMLGVSRDYIWVAPWILTFPGLAITLTVLGINLIGDWLRVLIDPRLRGA
jgi:peptide/nickel transport system permease protein